MRSAFTRIADISPAQLSVNVVAQVDGETFQPTFRPKNSVCGEDDAIGAVEIGDSSACVTLLVTPRHAAALGINDAVNQRSFLIIRNVVPSLVFGRLRLELNRFSSVEVATRVTGNLHVNKSHKLSLIDFDHLAVYRY